MQAMDDACEVVRVAGARSGAEALHIVVTDCGAVVPSHAQDLLHAQTFSTDQ